MIRISLVTMNNNEPLTWLEYIENMITFLQGKKSYLLALALFAYAFGGYVTGHMNLQEAVGLIWGSGVVASLRAAIDKTPPSN